VFLHPKTAGTIAPVVFSGSYEYEEKKGLYADKISLKKYLDLVPGVPVCTSCPMAM
jgi:hypothetical protein